MRQNAAQFRRARHSRPVIAGRMRGYTLMRRRVVERKDRIRRAARLECTDLLKIFTLKKQRRPARHIQPRACQHGRVMDVGTNPLMRSANAIEIYRHGSFYPRGRKFKLARCERSARRNDTYFACTELELRKCSGRGPRPMKRAGSCRRNGNHFSKRTTNGKDCLSLDARPVTTRR